MIFVDCLVIIIIELMRLKNVAKDFRSLRPITKDLSIPWEILCGWRFSSPEWPHSSNAKLTRKVPAQKRKMVKWSY